MESLIPFAICAAFVIPFVLVLLLNAFTIGFWHGVMESPAEVEYPPWCEADRPESFLREPANAMSDFAYLVVGLRALHLANTWINNEGPKNFLGSHPFCVVVWGALNIMHACGSFMCHACRCHSGHHFDVWSMASMVMCLLWLFAGRYYHTCVRIKSLKDARKQDGPAVALPINLGPRWYFFLGAAICVLHYLSGLYYADPLCKIREDWLVTSMVICILALTMATEKKARSATESLTTTYTVERRPLYGALVFLIIGKIAQEFDQRKIGCEPYSFLQGHAIWHITTAIAIDGAFRYMASETY